MFPSASSDLWLSSFDFLYLSQKSKALSEMTLAYLLWVSSAPRTKYYLNFFFFFTDVICLSENGDIGFSFSFRANVNTAHLAMQSCVNYTDHNIFQIWKICWRQSKYTILGKWVGKWENQLCICQVNDYVWPRHLSFKITTVLHKREYHTLAIKKLCTASCLTITEKSRHDC